MIGGVAAAVLRVIGLMRVTQALEDRGGRLHRHPLAKLLVVAEQDPDEVGEVAFQQIPFFVHVAFADGEVGGGQEPPQKSSGVYAYPA